MRLVPANAEREGWGESQRAGTDRTFNKVLYVGRGQNPQISADSDELPKMCGYLHPPSDPMYIYNIGWIMRRSTQICRFTCVVVNVFGENDSAL